MKYIDLTELLVPTGGIEIDLAREGVPEQGGPASAWPPVLDERMLFEDGDTMLYENGDVMIFE